MNIETKDTILTKTLDLAIQGDLEAIYQVVFLHYRKPLLVILWHFKKGRDDSWVDERLYDFYFYLADSVKKGRNKFANLDKEQNIGAFITTICHNWCTDEWRALSSQPKAVTDVDCVQAEEINEIENKYRKEQHIAAFVSAIMNINNIKLRDRYILLTYIICEYQKTGTAPLYLAKQISLQLGISEAAVKMAYRRSMDKLIANARESIKS